MLTQPVIFILIGLQAAVLALDPISRGENNPGDVNDDKVDKLIDIVKQQLEAQMLLLKSLATCKCRVCDKDVETEESINKHPGSSQQSQSGRRKGNILEETTNTISSRTILAAEQDSKLDPFQIIPDLPQAHGEVAPIKMFHNPISDKHHQEIFSTSASAQDTGHFTVTELSELENELEESPSDDVLRIEYDLNRSSPQNTGKSSRLGRRDNSTSPRRKIQKSTTSNIKVKKSTGSRTKVKKTTMLHSNLDQLSDLTTVKPIKMPVHNQRSGHWLFPHIKPKVDPVDVSQSPTLELEVIQTKDPAQVEEESVLTTIVEDESGETDEARRGRNAEQSRGSARYDKAGFSIFPVCEGDCPTFPHAFTKYLDSEE